MVIVNVRCLCSIGQEQRKPLRYNTSNPLMVQFNKENSVIDRIERFLKDEKKAASRHFLVHICLQTYSQCLKLHAEFKMTL